MKSDTRNTYHKPGMRTEKPGKRPAAPVREMRTQKEQTVQLTVRGMSRGVIRMEAEDGTAFACAKENARGALFGDTVLAERIGRDHVVVAKVLTHAHEYIMGVLRVHDGARVIQPLERRLPAEIAVADMNAKAEDGEIVRTHVARWEDEGGLCVSVEERIGSFQQATCALDALVMSMRLRTKFDDEVLADADRCEPADLADDPTREDMRYLLSFTIDGRDAKDFDDSVSLEPLENGNVMLGVHIADVGHYVQPGTALDCEAFARGTSVYLPGRVLPMLPEQLCNGVCSLRPNEDKFTLTALMEIDDAGRVVGERLARTITRSKARLVYDDVNALFAGSEQQTAAMAPLADTLRAMRTLAGKLRARRQAKGCIDFEIEEPNFVLDENGEPVEIIAASVRSANHVTQAALMGADIATAPFNVLKKMVQHPLTDRGLDTFMKDWEKVANA